MYKEEKMLCGVKYDIFCMNILFRCSFYNESEIDLLVCVCMVLCDARSAVCRPKMKMFAFFSRFAHLFALFFRVLIVCVLLTSCSDDVF